jgi:hypothetical protein
LFKPKKPFLSRQCTGGLPQNKKQFKPIYFFEARVFTGLKRIFYYFTEDETYGKQKNKGVDRGRQSRGRAPAL